MSHDDLYTAAQKLEGKTLSTLTPAERESYDILVAAGKGWVTLYQDSPYDQEMYPGKPADYIIACE